MRQSRVTLPLGLSLLFSFFPFCPVRAQVYQWQTPQGTLCFSDQAPQSAVPHAFCPEVAPQSVRRRPTVAPPEVVELLVSNVPIVNRPEAAGRRAAAALFHSTAQHILLEWDRTGRSGVPELKVIGVWQDVHGIKRRGHLGWVPATVTQRLATRVGEQPLGASLVAVVQGAAEESPRIHVDIWRPSAARAATPAEVPAASTTDQLREAWLVELSAAGHATGRTLAKE
jgi:hypothetical protein